LIAHTTMAHVAMSPKASMERISFFLISMMITVYSSIIFKNKRVVKRVSPFFTMAYFLVQGVGYRVTSSHSFLRCSERMSKLLLSCASRPPNL
jgi:hypothetical protein